LDERLQEMRGIVKVALHRLCCFAQPALHAWPTMGGMPTPALDELIAANRDELIRRCRAKVTTRSAPPPTKRRSTKAYRYFSIS
jgi:hypothetical protein